MFILKFFASIFLLFFALVFIFILVGLLLTKNVISNINENLSNKFADDDIEVSKGDKSENIPSAIECPKCGTFYAEMPKNKRCSCGAIL